MRARSSTTGPLPAETSVDHRGDLGRDAERAVPACTIAALALGLAYSRLDDRTAVHELTASGDASLLREARVHLRETYEPRCDAGRRALDLLEAAIADATARGSPVPSRRTLDRS